MSAYPYINAGEIGWIGTQMARGLVEAAGGIVLRREDPARIAVVRLRKRHEWVLPKGKLNEGETARAAAEREVLEETGHDVSVHEFLGTLVYEADGRAKAVHFWRMEAGGGQVHELMNDVKAVDWLPLEKALERLSRSSERAFLENVGPLAVQAAVHARANRGSRAEPEMPRLPTEPGGISQGVPTVPVLQSSTATGARRVGAMRRISGWLRRVVRPKRAAASGR